MKRFTLLHIGNFPDDWQIWLTASGVEVIIPRAAFPSTFLLPPIRRRWTGWVWRSAGMPWWRPTSRPAELVVPFEFKMSTELAYYLVYPPEAIRRRKIKAFRDSDHLACRGAATATAAARGLGLCWERATPVALMFFRSADLQVRS